MLEILSNEIEKKEQIAIIVKYPHLFEGKKSNPYSCFILTCLFPINVYIYLKIYYQNIFSDYVQKVLFSIIKNIPDLGEIKIIEYKNNSLELTDILKKFYTFNYYSEENFFSYQINNIPIHFAEIKMIEQKQIKENGKTKTTTTFQLKGIIYKIPKQYYNNQIKDPNIDIKQDNNYVYLIIEEENNKNSFVLGYDFLKPIDPQKISNYLQNVKEILERVKAYLT